MSFTFVQKLTAQVLGAGTPLQSAAMPSNPTVGNWLFCTISAFGSTTGAHSVSDTTGGNTWLSAGTFQNSSDSTDFERVSVFYCLVATTGANFKVSVSNTASTPETLFQVSEFSIGAGNTVGIDSAAGATGFTLRTTTSLTITGSSTANAGELLFAVLGAEGSLTTNSVSNPCSFNGSTTGVTSLAVSDDFSTIEGGQQSYVIATSAGTATSFNWTYSSDSATPYPQYVGISIAFKEVAPAASQPQDGELDQPEEDYDEHEGSTPQAALGGDQTIRQSFEAEWAEEDYDHHEGAADAQVALGGDNLAKQSYEAEWSDEDYDEHVGVADAQVALGGDQNIRQAFEAEWDDEDYDAHDGSTDAQPITTAVVLPLLQSYEAEYDEEDYDHHEGGNFEPVALGGDPLIRQSYEAEFAEEDYDAHEPPADVVQAVAPNDTTNAPGDVDDSIYWDGDDDLDIADDFDNTDPDRPWSEADEWIDDDYDDPDVSTGQAALGGDNEIKQSFEAEWADEDYDPHDGSTDPVGPSAVVAPDQPQSFEDEVFDEDDLSDGSTDPVAIVVVVTPDQPYSIEDDWIDDDYDALDTSTSDTLSGDGFDAIQSFEALLEDEDYEEHEGSTDAQAVVTPPVPDCPQSFDAEDSEEDYDAHDGSTDQVALGGDNEIRQSFEAEFDEEDYDPHDCSDSQPQPIFSNTAVFPPPSQVLLGVVYGPNGADYTGTLIVTTGGTLWIRR